MKILLVRCAHMLSAIGALAEAEGIEIVSAYYYDKASDALSSGVDGVITQFQIRFAENPNASPYGEGPCTMAWGIALAAKAQKNGVPVVVVTDSGRWEENKEFVRVLFAHLGKPAPPIMYAASLKTRHREVYMQLRKRMKSSASKNSSSLAGPGQK